MARCIAQSGFPLIFSTICTHFRLYQKISTFQSAHEYTCLLLWNNNSPKQFSIKLNEWKIRKVFYNEKWKIFFFFLFQVNVQKVISRVLDILWIEKIDFLFLPNEKTVVNCSNQNSQVSTAIYYFMDTFTTSQFLPDVYAHRFSFTITLSGRRDQEKTREKISFDYVATRILSYIISFLSLSFTTPQSS